MKKTILVVLIALLVAPTLAWAADTTSESDYLQISMMLSSSKKLSTPQLMAISEHAASLSMAQRTVLMEANKQTATLPFVLNLFVGMGIGSYVQGDSTGGTVGLVGELVSLSVALGGYGMMLNEAYTTNNMKSSTATAGSIMVIAGLASTLAIRIFEMIRPFTYANNYNKKLASSLMSVAVLPVVDTNNNLGMQVAANIKF